MTYGQLVSQSFHLYTVPFTHFNLCSGQVLYCAAAPSEKVADLSTVRSHHLCLLYIFKYLLIMW